MLNFSDSADENFVAKNQMWAYGSHLKIVYFVHNNCLQLNEINLLCFLKLQVTTYNCHRLLSYRFQENYLKTFLSVEVNFRDFILNDIHFGNGHSALGHVGVSFHS